MLHIIAHEWINVNQQKTVNKLRELNRANISAQNILNGIVVHIVLSYTLRFYPFLFYFPDHIKFRIYFITLAELLLLQVEEFLDVHN